MPSTVRTLEPSEFDTVGIDKQINNIYGGLRMSNGQGSTGNVIAAICSLFVPGLGQLFQGRVLSALFWFIAACIGFAITWLITLSLFPFRWFVVSVFSCISAARYRAG